MNGKGFSTREMAYLSSLPAVRSVGRTRIAYTDAFREECMRRYADGESPAEIFHDAGLDSALIGYKRIERCIARWRAETGVNPPAERKPIPRGRRRRIVEPA